MPRFKREVRPREQCDHRDQKFERAHLGRTILVGVGAVSLLVK